MKRSLTTLMLMCSMAFAVIAMDGQGPKDPKFCDRQGPGGGLGMQGMPGSEQLGGDEGDFRGHERRGGGKSDMIKLWLEKEMPELAQELQKAKDEDPELFRAFLKQCQNKQLKHTIMMGIKNRDKADEKSKELFKKFFTNEFQSLKLASQYRKATDEGQKTTIANNLKTILNETFEIKQQMQGKVVEDLEKRIVKVKEMIEKRKQLKDQIINQRLEKLTAENEYTEW